MRVDCALLTRFKLRPISPAPVLKTSVNFKFYFFLFPLSILLEYDIRSPDVNLDNEYNLYHAIYMGTRQRPLTCTMQCNDVTRVAHLSSLLWLNQNFWGIHHVVNSDLFHLCSRKWVSSGKRACNNFQVGFWALISNPYQWLFAPKAQKGMGREKFSYYSHCY